MKSLQPSSSRRFWLECRQSASRYGCWEHVNSLDGVDSLRVMQTFLFQYTPICH
jgi:hypothetical protein